MRFQETTTVVDGKEVFEPLCDCFGGQPYNVWYARFSRAEPYKLEAVCTDCHKTRLLGPEDVHRALEPQRLKDRLAAVKAEVAVAPKPEVA